MKLQNQVIIFQVMQLFGLFVSEESKLMGILGKQGLGRICLGVFPQVYLHLRYLVVLYIEHSLGFSSYGN